MPVSYYSQKMDTAQRNYDIYDKELLAIVETFREHRAELTSVNDDERVIKVLCDHKNLEYFMTTKVLSPRQCRWSEALSQYNFVITYRPGALNGRADALTRRPQDQPDGVVVAKDREFTLLPPGMFATPENALQANATTVNSLFATRNNELRANALKVNAATTRSAAKSPTPVIMPPYPRSNVPATSAPSAVASSANASKTSAASASPHISDRMEPPTSPPSPSTLEVTAYEHTQSTGNSNPIPDPKSTLEGALKAASTADAAYQEVIAALKGGRKSKNTVGIPKTHPALQKAQVHPSQCELKDGLIFVSHRLWVPADDTLKLRIVKEQHGAPGAGHPGPSGTLEQVRRRFYWPKMLQYIRRYVDHCRVCKSTKSIQQRPAGLLQPLPVPGQPWAEIAMDFVGPLPKSTSFEGVDYENILTVTCRLTKERHFIPVVSMSAKNTARVLCRDVFSKHGLPSHALSDRGPQFTSSVMRYAYKAWDVEQRLTSAYHPQADGSSENTNKGMEQYLRGFVNYKQDDWVEWLWMAEFVANNSVSASTGVTPFFANRGVHPRMASNVPLPPTAKVGPQRIDEEWARHFAHTIADLHVTLRQEMVRA